MSDDKKQAAPAEGAKETKIAKKSGALTKKKSAKAKVAVSSGRAYVQATYNNTIVTLTDQNGNVLSWSSSGSSGFKGPKKATPYAASVVVKNAIEKAAESGLKEVSVLVTGVGQGREGAIRAFNAHGLAVLSIKDITPIPHNGCRAPRPRRV